MGLMKRILESRHNRGRNMSRSWEGPFEIDFKEEGVTQRYERSRDMKAVDDFNQKVQAWSAKIKAQLPGSITSQGMGGKVLSRSIRETFKYDHGEIFRLGFSFARHGVYVHKGVGRGYRMNGEVVVKTARTTEGFNRKPKPWFNPVIESGMPELEQIVKEYTQTAIVNSTRIYIR